MKSPSCRLAFVVLTILATAAIVEAVALPTKPAASGGEQSASTQSSPPEQITIPGPLRSFLRMAGISQKAPADEVLPLLAEMVNARGYVKGKPTEFLILVRRYLQQANELAGLAPQGEIRVTNCHEAEPLLAILGYRLHDPCGPKTSVQTADPDRAFITIDSGFPLADLEAALRQSKPFVLPFRSSLVPVLFTPREWNETAGISNGDLVDTLLLHPDVARLFSALSHMDSQTSIALRDSPGLARLLRLAPVLDFYGGHLCIRSGRVLVPGGSAAEAAWHDLVGANPAAPPEFVVRLMARDAGWMAAYFDALSSVSRAQQTYFTDSGRLKHFYQALRGPDPSPGATKGVFRPDPGLVLLASRLQIEANAEPHIPGNLEVWKTVFQHNTDSRINRRWAGRARDWKDANQLVQGLIAVSREPIDQNSLQSYLTLSEIDRPRAPEERLTPQTARLLAEKFSRFGDQYSIFAEFSSLNNASIAAFLSTAEALDRIPPGPLRANAIGSFQAVIGLWQILARQGEIPTDKWNDSWSQVTTQFSQIISSPQLFDATRSSMSELWRAATGKSDLSQDEVIELLAGPPQKMAEGKQVRSEIAAKIQSVMSAQRLVSLDTLLTLGEGLMEMSRGKAEGDPLLPLAAELRQFEMPRPIFSPRQKIEFQAGHTDIRHTTLQTRTDLSSVIKSGSSQELAAARGRLAPFLRDTLIGLNYAYYQPPGAQMLFNNAIFVRSHDYTEMLVMEGTQPWRTPLLVNLGVTAGGGTHLAGSLADLPYVLSCVEQDFIIPEHVQSLIWQDLVPSLLTSAVVARWWDVTPNELHAVTLYQRAGETLLAASRDNEELRRKVMRILSDSMSPQRAERIESALLSESPNHFLDSVTPAETFFLAAEYKRNFPDQTERLGAAGKELDDLLRQYPSEVSWDRLSKDFGVSHPALAHTYGRELINQSLFPAFRDYSSRLLGESWESNNLYWARLADELGYPPVMLNRLVPELTRRMIEKLFATTLEDWPAIARAMRETGEEFRQGKIAALPKRAGESRP